MEEVSNFWPAMAVPITVKIPEPITAPIPRAVRETGPSVFFSRRSGCSESVISLSMDLQQKSWLSEVRTVGSGAGVGCDKRLISPEVRDRQHDALGQRVSNFAGQVRIADCVLYRFACPRASFFTLGFCDPRAYSRGLSGCSALRFFRAARFTFLRSSLLRVAVFAMSAFWICNLVIG